MPIQSCLSRGTPSNDISQPCRRKDPDLRAAQSKNAAGGKSERSFRSVYDKKYGTSASQESLANSSRRSSNSSISSNTSCRGYTARQVRARQSPEGPGSLAGLPEPKIR